MKICVVCDFFPPIKFGGAENIAYELSLEFLARNHSVEVITINPNLAFRETKIVKLKGIKITQIGMQFNTLITPVIQIFNPFINGILADILYQKDFDIFHLHNIHQYFSYYSIGVLHKFKKPIYLTAHDALMVFNGKYSSGVRNNKFDLYPRVQFKAKKMRHHKGNWKKFNLFRSFFINRQIKKIAKIICVSNELEFLLNTNGINNTTTIHNGIRRKDKQDVKSISRFKECHGIKDDDRIVLFAGRISAEKGLKILKKLVKTFTKKDKVKFLIVGKDLQLNALEFPNVINIEWVQPDEMQ